MRTFQHRDADRIPITDDPWETTLRRWNRAGMPAGTDWCDYFGIDKVAQINIDISPRFPETVVEETDRHIITTSPWGVTVKNFKNSQSTPKNIDYRVTTPEEWAVAKSWMTTAFPGSI